MIGDRQKLVLVGLGDIGEPIARHTDRHQVFGAKTREQTRGRRFLLRVANRRGGDGFGGEAEIGLRRRWQDDLLDPLTDLDDLHRAGRRMLFDAPALGPAICIVVVADIGEQQAGAGLVHDDADVPADTHRPAPHFRTSASRANVASSPMCSTEISAGRYLASACGSRA
jgi:hypothetical protein